MARKMTSIPLLLPTDSVISSQKATRLVKQDLPLIKSCWLSQITSLSRMSLNIASRRICSMIFPGTDIRLTSVQFPRSSFLSSLKMGVMFSPIFKHKQTNKQTNIATITSSYKPQLRKNVIQVKTMILCSSTFIKRIMIHKNIHMQMYAYTCIYMYIYMCVYIKVNFTI